MLELRNFSTGYARRPVVRGVDLEVRAGEIVALVGANGAGKSTIAKAVSGLLPPLGGEIRLDGRSIADLSPAERVRGGIVHVPEGRQIFVGLTVEENLELGAYSRRKARQQVGFATLLLQVYQRFPVLKGRARDVAGYLSGGQQQMLAIGRGLMGQPRLLILDEPSLGLAPSLVDEMFRLIAGLRAQGLAVLLVEQNARMSLAIADRGYVIDNGRVALSGNAAELMASDDIASRYLGLGEATVRDAFAEALYTRMAAAIGGRI
jgi:branched-chain amino acid transport system ATP-binding protein